MPKKFDSNANIQKICWKTKPSELDNEQIQSALRSLSELIRMQNLEISHLKKQLLAASNAKTINIENLGKVDSISFYMYLSEFYPEIFKEHRKKIQSSNRLKTLRFKNLKEAHLFLWDNYLKEVHYDEESPMIILSSWTKNIANPYKNPKEYVTAILIYLDYMGHIDYYGKSFNHLGEVKKGCFKFRSDDETNSIIQEAIEKVGIYNNVNKVKEVYSK